MGYKGELSEIQYQVAKLSDALEEVSDSITALGSLIENTDLANDVCLPLVNKAAGIHSVLNFLISGTQAISGEIEDLARESGKGGIDQTSLAGKIQALQLEHAGEGKQLRVLVNHEPVSDVEFIEGIPAEGTRAYINIATI